MTQMLSTISWGHPLVLEEGQRCEYADRRSQFLGFDEEAIG